MQCIAVLRLVIMIDINTPKDVHVLLLHLSSSYSYIIFCSHSYAWGYNNNFDGEVLTNLALMNIDKQAV